MLSMFKLCSKIFKYHRFWLLQPSALPSPDNQDVHGRDESAVLVRNNQPSVDLPTFPTAAHVPKTKSEYNAKICTASVPPVIQKPF